MAALNSTPLPLLTSLSALVPPSLYTSVTNRVTLLASHATPYTIEQEFFTPDREAIPVPGGRILRAQAVRKGKGGETSYKLQVLSKPIKGRGFEETRVQSCAQLDAVEVKDWDQLRSFVGSLGFTKSGSSSSIGIRYHLGPSLILTITRSGANNDEPYIAELSTIDPLAAHVPLENTVLAMEAVRERFRGLIEFSRGSD